MASSRAVPFAGPPAVYAMVLFIATAAFVAWRNSQVAVLVDIAYPLNTATRIALGDVPYRDFPLAQAPVHFLVQAALIRLLGPHFAVQIAYAAILGGAATVLTYVLARRLLAGAVRSPDIVAVVLVLPLVPLGIYAIYPHPFYDPDACLTVLASLAAILVARDRGSRAAWILAGASLTVPIWVKQNIGGAFLIAAIAALAFEAIARPRARWGVRWLLAGVAAALALEVGALQATVGLDSYVRWAWTYALSGRGVEAGRIGAFTDLRLLWPAGLIVLPALVASRLPPRVRAVSFIVALATLGVAGAAWPQLVLAVPELFPALLVAAAILALSRATRTGPDIATMLPFVLLVTTLGTLMSQGLGGSTFGIFPLLVLAISSVVRDLSWHAPSPARLAPMAGVVISLLLAVSGTVYTLSNARLRFIDVDAPGPAARSTFPSLDGMATPGPYLAELDEILEWTRENVPADESIAFLPGEDPVFFALARRPVLPAVFFFDVASPYPPRDIAAAADAAGLRWVFVKDRTQLRVVLPDEPLLERLLTTRATLVATVAGYRVYRR